MSNNLKKYATEYLIEFIKDTVKKANADGVIVGISGGIDSAVVANLAKLAFPNNYLTVWMPIESSDEDLKMKNLLIKKNNLNNISIDLNGVFNEFKNTFKDTEISNLAYSNTKARLRMTTIYSLAQSKNYLVLGTDNKDEWHIGYFTKYGDGAADLVPLIHLLKSEVNEIAEILNVPSEIINRPPTAGLFKGQTDEKEIGFSYYEIDKYLNNNSDNIDVKNRIDYLHKISEHKRNLPIQPKEYIRKQKAQ